MRRIAVLLWFAWLSLPLFASIPAPNGYEMLVLQARGQFYSLPSTVRDFNTSGTAVGTIGSSTPDPVIWDSETAKLYSIDTLLIKHSVLELPENYCRNCWDRDIYDYGVASSINNVGVIGGHFGFQHPRSNTQESFVQHSAVWQNGSLRFIHPELEAHFEINNDSNAISTTVLSIEDTSVVTGEYRTYSIFSIYRWEEQQVGKFTLDLNTGEITTTLVYDYPSETKGPSNEPITISEDGSHLLIQTAQGMLSITDHVLLELYPNIYLNAETPNYLVLGTGVNDYYLLRKSESEITATYNPGGSPFQFHTETDEGVVGFIGGYRGSVRAYNWTLQQSEAIPELYLNSLGAPFYFLTLDTLRATVEFRKFDKTSLIFGQLQSKEDPRYSQWFILRDKEAVTDSDSDGVLNDSDNCPATSNPEQNDLDNDGIGDACDSDIDGDLVDNDLDNCPLVSNQDQLDADADLIGDACDDLIDNDADGIANDLDNCPAVPNADQANNDQDAFGDACDADDDNDTVEDTADNCPLIANEDQADNEGDNIGDVCDSDDDNDAVEDTIDNCPLIANLDQEDNDSDGAGDVCDSDDDSDLIEDELDNCPLTFNPDQANTDGVGAGDACNDEFDLDDDDWENDFDNCPNVANRNQSDFDGDSTGDACDTDVDNDGVSNALDSCPLTQLGALVGSSGCSIEQLCPCDAPRQSTLPWKNHGQYVSCVTQAANTFYKEGLITGEEKGRMTEEAAQSSCGF